MFRLFRKWIRKRRIINELNKLTDRELSDIGITRGDFGQIVNKVVE